MTIHGDEHGNVSAQPMNEDVPLSDLTPSAAALARMQGVQVPAVPIKTKAELSKFDGMWLTYSREHGRDLGCDGFALAWNEPLSSMEVRNSPAEPIFRKSAGHLKSCWKQ